MPVLVAEATESGEIRWGYRTTRGTRWEDGTVSPRALGRKVYGSWAKIAREPTLRGLTAFLELVPRDHETHNRWRMSPHHSEWQDAAFRNARLNLLAPIEHGKTEQLTIGRTAWEIGIDPGLRHLIVQNTATMAVKTARAIRSIIEDSDDYRRVFPNVRPWPVGHPAANWTDASFTVVRRNASDRNPTLQATGLYGAVLGARIDRAKLDDVENLLTTRTPEARKKTIDWIQTTVWSRLTRRARVINAETSWHPDDLAHTLKRKGWHTLVYACRRPDGTFLWSRYDDAWEAEKRSELGPTAAARMLYNRVRADEEARFQEDWILRGLKLGEGEGFYPYAKTPPGFKIVVGVDLAVGLKEDNDLTAFCTLLVHPSGSVQVLNLESGRWAGPQIVERINAHSERYPGAVIVVENNGAQDYIRQFAAETVGRIIPYRTGLQKADPRFGIEAIATELFNGKIALPCKSCSAEPPLQMQAHPEIEGLVAEMLDYSPSAHTGDRLMSLWLAREGAIKGSQLLQNVKL